MRLPCLLTLALLGLLTAGCAGMQGEMKNETRGALAPTSELRFAFLLAPIYATKDATTGELKGVAVDLGTELAKRASVPFNPVVYANFTELLNGAKAGEWDVAMMGIDAQRAAQVDFSAPLMNVEQGYLVRPGLQITSSSAVDVPGVRIGVLEKSSLDMLLSQAIKNATLVRARTLAENFALLDAGKTDVMAATKPALFAGAEKRPGARVLDGQFPVDAIGMSVPKGRDAAAAGYVSRFVEEAKKMGLVGSAIKRAGLLGVVVAPPK